MMPHTIGDYYRTAFEHAKAEIESTPDDRVIGMDANEWIDYLIEKFGMSEIEFDRTRDRALVETETTYRMQTYAGRGVAPVVRGEPAVEVQVPVLPTSTLRAIWKHELAPNTYSISHGYPPFLYDDIRGLLIHTVSVDPDAVHRAFAFVESTVAAYNRSIGDENLTLRPALVRLVEARRDQVRKKHKSLDDLASAVGIPIRKKADAASVIPIAPPVRQKIAPVLPPASRPPTRPVLAPEKFRAILDLLDNTGRQFERTPQTFQQLTEEGLRDIALSNLNSVFEGEAGGETFRGIGKVDIHLQIAQGEVFVAEVKFWAGPESLKEVVRQLRERLTWRDAYGVALVLSRNAGFTEVLRAVRDTIPTCEGFAAGTLKTYSENHLEARFTIPSDSARQAWIHVLVYNLYTAEPGRRTIKRAKRR